MKKISFLFICFIFIFSLLNFNLSANDFEANWEYRPGDLPSGADGFHDFSREDEWRPFSPGSSIKKARNHNYLWLRVKLPEKNINNPTLYLPRVLEIEYPYPYQLYLNGDLIYQNGSLEGKLKLPEHNHSLVSLPQGWQGNYLYFRFYNNHHKFFIGEEIIASIAPYQNLINTLFTNSSLNLILGLTYLLLGSILIAIYLFKREEKIYLYLALFLLAISIYTLRYNEIISVIFADFNYQFYLLYYFSIFILAGSFSLFLSQIIVTKKFFFKTIGYIYFAALLFAIISYLLYPFSMFTVLKFYNLSIIVFAFLTYYQLIRALVTENDVVQKESRVVFLGVSVYGISVLLFIFDMLSSQFNFQFMKDKLNVIPLNSLSIGTFVLVLLLLYLVGKRFAEVYNNLVHYSQKLKETNVNLNKMDKFKDEFIAATSEELKFPLNNMISTAESVIRNNLDTLSQAARENLSVIVKIGQGLSYLLDSFIDYRAIKQETINSQVEYLELSSLINYIIDFFQPLLTDKKVKIINKIKSKQFIVLADRSQFIQAVYNLLVKITNSIEDGVIYFNAVKNEKSIKIKLKIEADNILFKFLAVHENLKQKSKYISEADDFKQLIIQKLLQVQSGKLQVKKLANRSLCLIITMPGEAYSDSYQLETGGTYSVKEGDDFETKLETTSSSEKKSIFIFGQQMRNIGYIKEVIAAEDYLIAVFPEKKQLVENLDSQVSLVIFDLFSLEQSDLKLCSQIRDRFKLFELPILVIVSHNEPENLIRGFESGINDFVQKPFAASELKAKIRTLITLKQKVEESIQREQDFLRAQIRPHFLYNTLDTIAYLCENKPGQASKLVIELANYLRHSFDFNSLDKLISIEKEIELVRFYLNIQQARFEDKINVNYNITTELYFRVPPLILQPLVENAVKHGILPREKGGQITIQITETKDHFVIEVIDDGVGMSEDKLKEVFSDFDGNQRRKVGIRNINRRLKKLYGQKLEIESKKGRGTAVKFKIPHR